MMVFMLTLAFPRETAGATFFRQYDKNGNHSLTCSQSATKYAWYRGRGSPSSLQEFEGIDKDRNKISTPQCAVNPTSHDTNKTLHTSGGGVFACAPWTENRTCPLFSNSSHCSSFDFFIVAIRNLTEEVKTFGNISKLPVLAIREKDPLNLTCELQIKNSPTEVALYWFKETAPSLCLFSAENEGHLGGNFSSDVNCCVDPAVKQRRTDHSVSFNEECLRQHLTIVNASSSDSGTYLCVVAVWTDARKRVWTVARNVSVEVATSAPPPVLPPDDRTDEEGSSPDSLPNALPVSLGVIGGVILIGGILGLLYWKKKAKGNPVEERPRNQMEMEEDDCSPYAVSSRKDIDRNEAMYSVVTYSPETGQGTSILSDGNPASQPGEKVHTVYALLSK
ncbi:UNVERIFIED_CONTAM: hypothetical protein K2H54_011102 [Gekko kuhli]